MSDKNTADIVTGVKQTLRMIEQGALEIVYIAEDADIFVTKNVEQAARREGIEVIHIPSKRQLGAQCGIEIGAAAAGRIARNDRK